jgi:Uma2 family endonuclease
MSISFEPLPGTVADPLYPDSDGELMGETDFHMDALILLREGLRDFFRRQKDVYVASDMFWYWQRGNPRACKAPDVLVAKGVGKHARRSFRSWEEKANPRVLFEITSEKTVQEDVGEKKTLYERLRVPEYFIFDPEGTFLDPPLQGFRLVGKKYRPIAPEADGSLVSQELGLRLVPEGTLLRLIDLATGKPVLTRAERADEEQQRADKEQQRADKEQQRADKEQQRADEEKQRADALAAELARLRAKRKPKGPEK